MKTLVAIFLFSLSIFAQDFRLSGVVKDASSGDVLPFANIGLKDGSNGVNADINGKFSLLLPAGTYEFIASYVGYKTETFTFDLKENIQHNINLVPTGILLQEVSVYAAADESKKSTVSSISLQSKEIQEISSVFPDVFRSIQSLPGIAVDNEFSAKFNVRGGTFDENLVLVNGTQVYEPFHVKEADNASVGIFNLDLMKKVNLINGGFSAQYGDRLSSVLNIEYRDGSKDKQTGSASLSLTNLDTYVEGPISQGVTYILGIRKSYMEYIMSLLDFEKNVRPSFYDVQGVLTYQASDMNKFQLKFIHAGDDFIYDPRTELSGPNFFTTRMYGQNANGSQSETSYHTENANYYSNLFDLQNTLFLSNNAFLNTSVSYYHQIDRENNLDTDNYLWEARNNRYYFYKSYFESDYVEDLTIKTWEAKTSLDMKLNPYYDIKSGFSYINVNYKEYLIDRDLRNISQNVYQFPDTVTQVLDQNFNYFPQNIRASSYKLAGYLENIFQINDNFILNAGGRVDYFDFNRDLTLSPRLSASYKLGTGLNIRAAWGYYYQSPIYRQLAYSFASDSNTQSQKAEHYILGVEQSFNTGSSIRDNMTIKLEGYYKKYTDLISADRRGDGNINYTRRNDSKGYAAGIDLFVSLKFEDYYGWISYGLLVAKEDLLTDSLPSFPRFTDQRHTISFVNDFNLGKNWSLNLRFAYGSGFAYTPYYSEYNTQQKRYEWIQGGKNSSYLPGYKRVDARVSKLFTVFGLNTTAFIDVSNLFSFKNTFAFRYRFDTNGNPKIEEVELWPMIPSFGLTVNF